MAALGFLIAGLVCAVVSRILLLVAAANIGVGWAFGMLLPFGPLAFRLCYPDEARKSFYWRLATLPCLGMFFLLGSPIQKYREGHFNAFNVAAKPASGYALEKPAAGKKPGPAPGPTVETQVSLEDRRAANTQEFARLRTVQESLKKRKRDLLHSDAQGNIAYNNDLHAYNAALAKATADRNALWPTAR